MVGVHGVHGRNVLILVLKNTQVWNQFVNDIDDVIHRFRDWVVNHVLATKSSNKFVVFHFVQLLEDGRNGLLGVLVLQRAEVEQKFAKEIVTIHLQVTVVLIAKAIIAKAQFALCNLVPVCKSSSVTVS